MAGKLGVYIQIQNKTPPKAPTIQLVLTLNQTQTR